MMQAEMVDGREAEAVAGDGRQKMGDGGRFGGGAVKQCDGVSRADPFAQEGNGWRWAATDCSA